MFLFTITISLVYRPIVPFYAAGYTSHLAIDLLNKKGVQLLFPLKFKLCLGLCYANKAGNTIIMYIGLGSSIALLAINIIK